MMKTFAAIRSMISNRSLGTGCLFFLILGGLADNAPAAIGDKLPTARLLWVRGSTIMSSPIKGWSEKSVTPGSRPRWKPDGTRIVYASGSDVWLMNADFSGEKVVLPNAGTADWFPDENAITAIASDGYRVLKHNLGTGKTTTIYDARGAGWNGQKVSQVAELRTGGRYLLLFRLTPRHVTFIADLQQKKYIANSQMSRGDCSPAWTPNGSYILNTARTFDRPVLRADFNAAQATIADSKLFYGLTTGDDFYIHGQRISNDGKWLVCGVRYRSGSNSGNREIFIWEIGTSNSTAVRLTNNKAEDKTPSLYIPPSDTTPPSAPSSPTAQAASPTRIDLTWSAASDPDSGVVSYNIYRGATLAGTSATTSFSDTGLTEGTSYTYRISAVNGAGMEGPKGAPITKSTLTDTTKPTLTSAGASGDPTKVSVVFSEPVAQASAQDAANYALDNGATVSAASLGGDLKTVTLTVSTLAEGVTYMLTVNGVKDRATTPNTIAGGTTATFQFQADILAGLVAHWKLDDGSGAVARDSSSSGNNATVTGATWTTGKLGGGLRFVDGNSMTAATAVNLGADWTFAAWFTAPVPTSGTWQSLTRAGPGVDDHQVLVRSSLELGTYLNSGGGFKGTGFKLDGLAQGWHHVVAIGSGTTTAFYMDGVLVGTAGGKSTTEIYSIGALNTGSQRFSDTIDDVRIYNRALSAAEVAVVYGTTPPAASVAITSPAAGGVDLAEGADYDFTGAGTNLVWEYDADNDPFGPVRFGTGPSVTLSVPLDVTAPRQITIILTGDGGTARQTHNIVAPGITIKSPNGGEMLTAGQTYNIVWETVGIDDVTITYSADGGLTWSSVAVTVDSLKAGWGNYPWKVPDTTSSRGLIRVAPYLGGTVEDISDNTFEIIGSAPDVTPPTIVLSGLTLGGRIDDLSVSQVTIGGASFSVTAGDFTGQAALAGSPVTVLVGATDSAGRLAQRTVQITWQ